MLVYPFQGSRKEGHEARYWRSRLASRLRIFFALRISARQVKFPETNHSGTQMQNEVDGRQDRLTERLNFRAKGIRLGRSC